MTSILREFEKIMQLEPVQVDYAEPSILDSVDLSNATSTLSFNNYEVSFGKSEISFGEDDIGEQEPHKSGKNKAKLPFSKFYVGGKGILNIRQVKSLREYLISVRQYAGRRAAIIYNDIVDLTNYALSGHPVSKEDVNRLSEELFDEMKCIFEQQDS